MSQSMPPLPQNAKPLVPGYGATLVRQGEVELYRFLFCQTCGSMVPDEAMTVVQHNAWHERINNLEQALTNLNVIQEDP